MKRMPPGSSRHVAMAIRMWKASGAGPVADQPSEGTGQKADSEVGFSFAEAFWFRRIDTSGKDTPPDSRRESLSGHLSFCVGRQPETEMPASGPPIESGGRGWPAPALSPPVAIRFILYRDGQSRSA